MSYTYAVLNVSKKTFQEIKKKLEAAEYPHAFDRDVIDMHGIALRSEPDLRAAPHPHKKPCVCSHIKTAHHSRTWECMMEDCWCKQYTPVTRKPQT